VYAGKFTNQHQLPAASAAESTELPTYQTLSTAPALNPTVIYDQPSRPSDTDSHNYYNVRTNRL